MNATRTSHRIAAAVASVVITFSILTGLATAARPPAAQPVLLAMSGVTLAAR